MWWEVKNHLEIRKGALFIGNKSVLSLAEEHETPFYVYNLSRVKENYRKFYSAIKKHTDKDVKIYYAMKSNSNGQILKTLKNEGSGIDAVSPQEVEFAIECGFPKERISFTGTSVSNKDLKRVVELGAKINIDSLSELRRLKEIKVNANVSLRIDPNLKGLGHDWKVMTVGKTIHGTPIKFSIPKNDIIKAARMAKGSGSKIIGIHEHVGSNWLSKQELSQFLKTVDVLLSETRKASGYLNYDIKFVNFGGGPGVRYKEKDEEFPLDLYASQVCRKVEESKLDIDAIGFEPGRYIVADSGILAVQVVDVKKRYGDIIIGVNSGFNHLVRTAMYNSYHEIINCSKINSKRVSKVIVAGYLCETGDVFTTEKRSIQDPEEGDILAIHNAGAYGYSMASTYNMRPLPKEIAIN